MKSWLKSKTVWINGILEAMGILLLAVDAVAAFLPSPMAAKAVGISLIITGVMNQIIRVFTKLGITVSKDKIDPANNKLTS